MHDQGTTPMAPVLGGGGGGGGRAGEDYRVAMAREALAESQAVTVAAGRRYSPARWHGALEAVLAMLLEYVDEQVSFRQGRRGHGGVGR